MKKLFDAPSTPSDFNIQCDDNIFVPKGVVKKLKRVALEMIQTASLNRNKVIIKESHFDEIKSSPQQQKITVKVETLEQYNYCITNNNLDVFVSENLRISHPNIYQNRIIKDYRKYQEYDQVIIQDFGSLIELDTKKLTANYHMNIVNSYSVFSMVKRGVTKIGLSLESTFENTSKLINEYVLKHKTLPNLEVMIYGRNDNMISKYCPITKSEGVNRINCNLCVNNKYALINSFEKELPLIRDTECNIRVLNHKPINLINQLKKYKEVGISNFRIEFTIESKDEVQNIINKVLMVL